MYLILWTLLFRSGRRSIVVSLQGLSSQTGLSKSAVQAAVRILRQRGWIKVIRAAPTSVPQYELVRHWLRRRERRSDRPTI